MPVNRKAKTRKRQKVRRWGNEIERKGNENAISRKSDSFREREIGVRGRGGELISRREKNLINEKQKKKKKNRMRERMRVTIGRK